MLKQISKLGNNKVIIMISVKTLKIHDNNYYECYKIDIMILL